MKPVALPCLCYNLTLVMQASERHDLQRQHAGVSLDARRVRFHWRRAPVSRFNARVASSLDGAGRHCLWRRPGRFGVRGDQRLARHSWHPT